MFSGNGWAVPKGSKNVDDACKYMKAVTSVDAWVTAAKKRLDARKAAGSTFTGLYTANAKADMKVYEDIYQSFGKEQFDNAVKILVARRAVRLRAAAVPGRPAVRAGLPRRGQPRADRPADAEAGARPGPEGSAGRDRRQQEVASTVGAWQPSPQQHARRRAPRGPGAGSPVSARRRPGSPTSSSSRGCFGFLIFTLGPMLFSLYYSFTNYGVEQIAGLEPTKTVGLDNYQQLLDDPKVAASLKNTFIYTVMMVPGKIIVALLLAMLLMRVGQKLAGDVPHDLLPAAHDAAGRHRGHAALPLQRPAGRRQPGPRTSASRARTGRPTRTGSSRASC